MLSQKVGTSSAVTDQPATEPHGLRQMRQMISLAALLDYIIINTFFFSPLAAPVAYESSGTRD